MIARDVSLLQKELTQQRAQIYEKEIEYLYRELSTVSASASVLGGFVYNSLNLQGQHALPGAAPLLHCTSAALALLLSILAVVLSTFLSVLGTNMALRGDDDGMRRAVVLLRQERRLVLELFVGGTLFFFVSCICSAWQYWDRIEAGLTTVLVGSGVVVALFTYGRISRLFDTSGLGGGHAFRLFTSERPGQQWYPVLAPWAVPDTGLDARGAGGGGGGGGRGRSEWTTYGAPGMMGHSRTGSGRSQGIAYGSPAAAGGLHSRNSSGRSVNYAL